MDRENQPFSSTRMLRAGLGVGDLGVVAARAGVGKSSCLVQLATAELLEGNPVLHVSLDNPVGHVRRWYDNQIDRIKDRMDQPVDDLRLEVERRRHIHSYLGDSFTADKLESSCGFLKEHMDFEPRLAVVDGFPFDKADEEQLAALKSTAKKLGMEVWLSALTHRDEPDETSGDMPFPLAPYASTLDAVVALEPESDGIGLRMWRAGQPEWKSLPPKLGPRTLLFS